MRLGCSDDMDGLRIAQLLMWRITSTEGMTEWWIISLGARGDMQISEARQ